MKFYFVHIAKVCFVLKKQYTYIIQCMHKTLLTLGNEAGQEQIKFYKKLSGELIFSRASKNLKIFYFTRPTG